MHTADDGNKSGWPTSAGSVGGRGGIAPSMQQKWMVCAASHEHNVQLPVLEAYLLRVDHDPICAIEMALTGQYPIELLAEATPTSAAGKAMLAHNTGRTPLCILHQICWGVVRAVVVLPSLSLLEQYAVTHRSKLWGRVVASKVLRARRRFAAEGAAQPRPAVTRQGDGKQHRPAHRFHQHGRCGGRLQPGFAPSRNQTRYF